MTAILYRNTSSSKTLNKILVEIGRTNLTLYELSDLLNPRFKLKNKTTANYLFIQDLGYYYINNQILGNQCCFLVCEKDVLMSNKSEILNLDCFVLRNEYEYNLDIPDNLLPLQEKNVIYSRTDYNNAPDIGNGTIIMHAI